MNTKSRAAIHGAFILSLLFSAVACSNARHHGSAETSKASAETNNYISPYRMVFQLPAADVETGLNTFPWNSTLEQSSVPAQEWYSRGTKNQWKSWGPPQRRYPAAPRWSKRSQRWLQERVLRTALRYQGLSYQHHHIPAWDPPADWPWKRVKSGHQGPGLDCSNFTGFVYNYALGVKMSTGIREQATMMAISAPGSAGVLPVLRIDKQDYATTVNQLQPADLLYIRNKRGELAHVIMWLGDVGISADGTPLVIDSTGSGHKDSQGNIIPDGVQLRPFSKESWYWQNFDHAHRIVSELGRIRQETAPDLPEGGADDLE